jgi:hypothetical protein
VNLVHGRRSKAFIESQRAIRAEVRLLDIEAQNIARELAEADKSIRADQEATSAQPMRYLIILPVRGSQ